MIQAASKWDIEIHVLDPDEKIVLVLHYVKNFIMGLSKIIMMCWNLAVM